MVRISVIFVVVFICNVSFSQEDISSVFDLKWKQKIGVTTYRTNIVEENGFIFIGSNGEDANKLDDELDGVFQLNAKTGGIVHHFKSQLLGDNDATGIAIDDGKLFFGTDNYYLYCFDIQTKKELWKFPVDYDIESVPALTDLNNDGVKDVVFSVQHHGFYALNGIDGTVIWKREEFDSHQGNPAPLLVDCNKDGILDCVMAIRSHINSDEIVGFKMVHYGDYFIAFDGKDGNTLWVTETGAGIHASPFLFENSETKELQICGIDAYGYLQILNLKGESLKSVAFGYDVYSSPIVCDTFLIEKSIVVNISEKYFEDPNEGEIKYLKHSAPIEIVLPNGDLSATPIVADVLGNGALQIVDITENGYMFIKSLESEVLKKLIFPEGAEASLLVKDIDGDGLLEILLASLDGYLYCYDTKSSGEVYYGQFRWNNHNVPDLK